MRRISPSVAAIPYSVVVILFVVVIDQLLERNLKVDAFNLAFFASASFFSFLIIRSAGDDRFDRWIAVFLCTALFAVCFESQPKINFRW